MQPKTDTAMTVMMALGFTLLQCARLLDETSGPCNADPLSIPGVAVGSICCIVVAVCSYRAQSNGVRVFALVGSACMIAWLLLSNFTGLTGAASIAVRLLSGAGWMALLVCWMQVISVSRPRFCAPIILVGWLISLLVAPLFSSLPADAQFAGMIALLLASVAVLAGCLAFNRGAAAESSAALTHEIAGRALFIISLVAVVSFACGLALQGDIAGGHNYMESSTVSVFGTIVYGVLLAAFVAFKPVKKLLTAFFPACIALLSVVLIGKALIPGGESLGGAMMVALLMTLSGLFWIAFLREAHERNLPAVALLGAAVGSAQLCVATGRAAWFGLAILVPGIDGLQTTLVALLILAVGSALVIAAMVLNGKLAVFDGLKPTSDKADGISDSTLAGASREDEAPSHQKALDLLSSTHGLSKREAEVLSEYSMGRSARVIANRFFVSEHTVKSHLRRAYAKLDVHSRQELLDLIELMER